MTTEMRLFPKPEDVFLGSQSLTPATITVAGAFFAEELSLARFLICARRPQGGCETRKASLLPLLAMIPARPSPDEPDPNVMRKNRKFLLLALLVGLICSLVFGTALWLINR